MDAPGSISRPQSSSSCTTALKTTIDLSRRTADSPCRFPLVAKVRRGVTPVRKLEGEPAFEQSLRDDAAALQNELGFSPHECRTDLEHPVTGRQTERHTVRVSKHLHELGAGQWVRRREIHGAVHVASLDQPPHRRDEIPIMNPGYELAAAAGAATQTATHESE